MTAHTVPNDPDVSWRDDAACLDHPADWFTGPQQPGDTRRALEVCNTCPVKRPCLEAALGIEISADIGIWGGTTPTTRRRIRRGQTNIDEALRSERPPNDPGEDFVRSGDLELRQDEHGDHIDDSRRVIVFEIHGEPPYMLMIDGKPRARTMTILDAAALAERFMRTDRCEPAITTAHCGDGPLPDPAARRALHRT
jgi:hypothetical protein